MTKEQQRVYMREWRRRNRDRVREQELERDRQTAISAIESVEQLPGNVFVIHSIDGQKYVVSA